MVHLKTHHFYLVLNELNQPIEMLPTCETGPLTRCSTTRTWTIYSIWTQQPIPGPRPPPIFAYKQSIEQTNIDEAVRNDSPVLGSWSQIKTNTSGATVDSIMNADG